MSDLPEVDAVQQLCVEERGAYEEEGEVGRVVEEVDDSRYEEESDRLVQPHQTLLLRIAATAETQQPRRVAANSAGST